VPILVAAVSVYSLFLLIWYRDVFPGKPKQLVFIATSTVLCILVFILSVTFDLRRIGFFLFFGILMLACKMTFYATWLQASYFSTFYILSVYSSRGIVAAFYSTCLNISISEVLRDQECYNTIWLLAALLSILILLFRRRLISNNNQIKQLFRYPAQIKFVVNMRIIFIVYMALIDNGRFYRVAVLWYSTIYFLSCIMIKLLMLLFEKYVLRVITLLEYETNTKRLEEQQERLMRHYKSYKRYTRKFAAFQHDFKHMMAAVKTLVVKEENEKALVLMDEIFEDLNSCSVIRNSYSDNIMVDAILQDTFERCEDKLIRFEGLVHLPPALPFSDLNLVRLLTNVINNAVEACEKVPVHERYIEVNGYSSEGWMVIEIANSYDGLASLKGENLVTNKSDKQAHGFGILIIKEIAENAGGFVSIEPNQQARKFVVRIHIPYKTEN